MADLYQRLKQFKQNNSSAENNTAQSNNGSNNGNSQKPEPPKPSTKSTEETLNQKLTNIPGIMRGRELIDSIQKRDSEKQQYLHSIGVEERENEHGSFGFKEIFYPSETLPYNHSDIKGVEVARQAQDQQFLSIQGKNILFIDTETTGLAGGTGTVPFLIGAGFFTETGFIVQQFFMRDYDDEPAVLAELNKLCEKFSAVSTYNGKNFDIPILNSRYLLNRSRTPLSSWPHYDLLYSARRFWREMLPNCRLSTVESSIFGHSRQEDIPGELIPYVYFDFIRGIRMHRINPVLAHNAEDIRSLALIAAKICRMLQNPEHECTSGYELMGVGKYFMSENDFVSAQFYFQMALDNEEFPEEKKYTFQKQLSLMYKRCNQYDQAAKIWHEMILTTCDCFAYIELAKWYEHKQKQCHEALKYTELALDFIRFESVSEMLSESLKHRRNRLLRKINSIST